MTLEDVLSPVVLTVAVALTVAWILLHGRRAQAADPAQAQWELGFALIGGVAAVGAGLVLARFDVAAGPYVVALGASGVAYAVWGWRKGERKEESPARGRGG